MNYENVVSADTLAGGTANLAFFANLTKPTIIFAENGKPAEPERLNASGGDYVDGELKYVFTIGNDSDASPALTTYDCKLYLDLNFDGNLSDKEEQEKYIVIQDENGKDVNFEHLMTIEHEGNYYVVLEATEDTDDCKEGEAIILKIVRDEESDEDVYATIEDEAEFNAVFDKCMAAMEEEDEAAALEMEAVDLDVGDEE